MTEQTKSISFRGGGSVAGAQVQACREGRMTQHRVPSWIKSLKFNERDGVLEYEFSKPRPLYPWFSGGAFDSEEESLTWFCTTYSPFGQPGTILSIKEAFGHCGADNPGGTPHTDIVYRADGDGEHCPCCGIRPRWYPPQYMIDWKVRTFRRVKRVWVERLQDISEEDAKAEGVRPYVWFAPYGVPEEEQIDISGMPGFHGENLSYRNGFATLFDRIYGKAGHRWENNQYVFACEWKILKEGE